MAATTVPTPLYPIYQQRLGFPGVLVTVIFAVYALGVIAGLLAFGQVSDAVGRRPALLVGLTLSGLGTAVFLLPAHLPALFAGRVLTGLAAGMVVGAASAWLVDLAGDGRRAQASMVAIAVNTGGLAVGPLLSGVLAQLVPNPLTVPYAAELILLLVGLASVWAAPETVTRAHRARVRPQRLGVPPEVRGAFAPAVAAGFCSFAISGLFGAVAPTFLLVVLKLPSHVLAGLLVFVLFASSAAGQLLVRRVAPRLALVSGCTGLAAGAGMVAAAVALAQLWLIILAAAVAGCAMGLILGAGLSAINARTPADRRGETASTYFVILYVGLSLPVIGVGIAADLVGLRLAGFAFGLVLAGLVLAILVLLRRTGAERAAPVSAG